MLSLLETKKMEENGKLITIDDIYEQIDEKQFQEWNWTGTFDDYLKIVQLNPVAAKSAFQRLYDMILYHGTETYVDYKKKITRYKIFTEFAGKDAIYGLDVPLMKFVNFFKAAARRYGTEKRVLLLHGPVGCAKSTIVRILKKGLEDYSKKEEGALFSYSWICDDKREERCPMNEEPLKLLSPEEDLKNNILKRINEKLDDENKIYLEGDLCPFCRQNYKEFMNLYGGNWAKMVKNHIKVRRVILSEKDRMGIGTFQPKDEKNQDSTELTGDINYRKIAQYGSDSDPRAFNFDGEFNIANRGLVEFIEVLKLDVAFLYDLLGASQEHKIKPKKFAQTDIDEVIIGHTNEPEYRKLQKNEFMEALRDRTVKIDIPYITKWGHEIQIYKRDYSSEKIKGRHIAPHTLEMAAFWVVLTRLEEPKKAQLSLVQKLKLYDGKTLPGFTEDNVKELRKEAEREGMDGISPRYVQDKIANALIAGPEETAGCLNPFMVLDELGSGLQHHSLITSEDQRKRFTELLGLAKAEYEEIVKNEVQEAISADEEALKRLCGNYIDSIKAYTQKEKIKNKYTHQDEPPDERLMRSVEERSEIEENRKDEVRREIMNYIGALAIDGKKFDYKTNERLLEALKAKLFEDNKDSIKLSSIVSRVVDEETQKKINVIKTRLIERHGYCEICATDVLNFVASILARGEQKG